jgi:hypothetical protein
MHNVKRSSGIHDSLTAGFVSADYFIFHMSEVRWHYSVKGGGLFSSNTADFFMACSLLSFVHGAGNQCH